MPEAVGAPRVTFRCPDCGDSWEMRHVAPERVAFQAGGTLTPEFCPTCGKRVGRLYAPLQGAADAVAERFRRMPLLDQARIAEAVQRSFMAMQSHTIDRKEMR